VKTPLKDPEKFVARIICFIGVLLLLIGFGLAIYDSHNLILMIIGFVLVDLPCKKYGKSLFWHNR
jgi:membrane-bound ClpP family serine protease